MTAVHTAAQTHGNVTASAANLRQGPDTSSTVLAKIPRGESAKLVRAEAFGDWYYVEYNGKTGWLHKSTIDLVTIGGASDEPARRPLAKVHSGAGNTARFESSKYDWRYQKAVSGQGTLRIGIRKKNTGIYKTDWVMESVKPGEDGTLFGSSRQTTFQWVSADCERRVVSLHAEAEYDVNGIFVSHKGYENIEFENGEDVHELVWNFIFDSICTGEKRGWVINGSYGDGPINHLVREVRLSAADLASINAETNRLKRIGHFEFNVIVGADGLVKRIGRIDGFESDPGYHAFRKVAINSVFKPKIVNGRAVEFKGELRYSLPRFGSWPIRYRYQYERIELGWRITTPFTYKMKPGQRPPDWSTIYVCYSSEGDLLQMWDSINNTPDWLEAQQRSYLAGRMFRRPGPPTEACGTFAFRFR